MSYTQADNIKACHKNDKGYLYALVDLEDKANWQSVDFSVLVPPLKRKVHKRRGVPERQNRSPPKISARLRRAVKISTFSAVGSYHCQKCTNVGGGYQNAK